MLSSRKGTWRQRELLEVVFIVRTFPPQNPESYADAFAHKKIDRLCNRQMLLHPFSKGSFRFNPRPSDAVSNGFIYLRSGRGPTTKYRKGIDSMLAIWTKQCVLKFIKFPLPLWVLSQFFSSIIRRKSTALFRLNRHMQQSLATSLWQSSFSHLLKFRNNFDVVKAQWS